MQVPLAVTTGIFSLEHLKSRESCNAHVLFTVVKCVIVASPGFLKNQFFEWMIAQAVKLDNRLIMDNKSKFLLVHSSSGHKHALKGKSSLPS